MSQIKGSDFSGKTVTTSEGRVVGTIQDVIIDAGTWAVSDIQVKIDKATAKELGLKAPLFGSLLLLVETVRIQSASDQIVVDIPVEGFADYVNGRDA